MLAFIRKPGRQTAVRRRTQRLAAIGAVLAFAGGTLLRAQTGTPLLQLQGNSNSISFGSQPVASTTAPRSIVLSNGGTAPLQIFTVTIGGLNPGDFTLTSTNCVGASLAPGASCVASVAFTPAGFGARSGRLTITDNASGSPHLIGLAGEGADPSAHPKAVGPIDVRIGFPSYYTDQNGLSLAPCIDSGSFCLTNAPDLTRPPAVTDDPATTNMVDEFFYYELDTALPNFPGNAQMIIALEGAFNTPGMEIGQQSVFGRVRIRVRNSLKPNTNYKFTTPYGSEIIQAEGDGSIFFTADIGNFGAPSDFSEALLSKPWPFLPWAPNPLNPADKPPAGFIGDPNVAHKIVPGPGGSVFRMQELNASGAVVATIDQTDLFTVAGRILGGPVAPPTPNQPPVAGNDTGTSLLGADARISVLDNDIDPDGDPLQISAVGTPAHGSASLNNNGVIITYTPEPGFAGVDSFTYTIDDFRGGSATATVTVTVTASTANQPPVAVADVATTITNTPVIIGPLLNDTDPEGDVLSILSATNGAHGTAVVNAGLTITYTPATGFTGADQFSYTISDGRNTASSTVTMTVTAPPPPNRAPIANADTATTKPGVPVRIDVVGGTTAGAVADTDPDGDAIVLATVQSFVGGAAAIQLDGTVIFTPAAGFSGAGSFTYTINDGRGGSATGSVTVNVNAPTRVAQAFSDGTGARSALITTTGPTVLVALVASDGPTPGEGANNQFLTVSGGGLVWTRLQRAAGSRGVSEIWTANAPAALTNAAITSTQSVTLVLGAPVNQSLSVAAFSNATGVGASAIRSAASGAPTISLVTTSDNSLIYGVGNDFDRAIARTVGTGQTKLHEFLSPSGDTMWTQFRNALSGPAGSTVTLNDTAPTGDQWNFAIVEIR
ncbi:MAG TPA: Ig-like domain-containing protein [Vicinamibacterales bacterium]|nr:Ig-like domain-containing protein [Vicinamibacterales bacterium]